MPNEKRKGPRTALNPTEVRNRLRMIPQANEPSRPALSKDSEDGVIVVLGRIVAS